jgi:hypothetical protein
LSSPHRCQRCIARDRKCCPREIEGRSQSVSPISPSPIVDKLASPTRGPSRATTTVDIEIDVTNQPSFGSDLTNELTGKFVLSELIGQIPSLTSAEALPLSQMITGQLRRWKWPQPILTFRRTKILENISRASVTIIDFDCVCGRSQNLERGFEFQQSPSHHYASTIVMSDITNPENPEHPVSCLWAPAYEGRDGSTFSKESAHLLSVLGQCWEGGADYNERLRTSVATAAINDLYGKHFTQWTPRFVSAEAAIQRACAWGIVAAKSREIEYRLFAASLSHFLNSQINFTLRNNEFGVSLEQCQNDLCYLLVPVLKLHDKELGKPRIISAYA